MKAFCGKLKEDAYFHELDQNLIEKMKHRERREEKAMDKDDSDNVVEFDQSRRKNRQDDSAD